MQSPTASSRETRSQLRSKTRFNARRTPSTPQPQLVPLANSGMPVSQGAVEARRAQPFPISFESGSASPEPRPSSNAQAMLLHDVRNLMAALQLYADMLEEPGVLTPRFRHYAADLRQVVLSSGRLLDRLADSLPAAAIPSPLPGSSSLGNAARPIQSVAAELMANRTLLTALVGPAITLGICIHESARNRPLPVALTSDDVRRILVNLVRNASEAMPAGGHIQIELAALPDTSSTPLPESPVTLPCPAVAEASPLRPTVLRLTISDSGLGIPASALETVFTPGYSTHVPLDFPADTSLAAHPTVSRGLGLSIVRSLVASAGGRVWAENRQPDATSPASPPTTRRPHRQSIQSPSQSPSPGTGAVFHLEFPVTSNAPAGHNFCC